LRLSGREHMSGYNVFYKQPLAVMPMLCGRPLPTPSREAAVRRPPLYPTQTFLPPSGPPKILPSCVRPRHTRPLPENMPTAWWTHPLPPGWQSTLLPKYVCWSRWGAPPPPLPVTSAAADATATAAAAAITAKAMPAVAVRVVSGAPPSTTQLAAVTQPKSTSARARGRGGAGAVEVLPPHAMRRLWRGRHLRRGRPGQKSHAQRSAAHRHVQCRRHHQRHRCSPQQHRLRRCRRRDDLDAAPFAPPALSRGAPPCAGSGVHARTATTAGGGPHNTSAYECVVATPPPTAPSLAPQRRWRWQRPAPSTMRVRAAATAAPLVPTTDLAAPWHRSCHLLRRCLPCPLPQ